MLLIHYEVEICTSVQVLGWCLINPCPMDKDMAAGLTLQIHIQEMSSMIGIRMPVIRGDDGSFVLMLISIFLMPGCCHHKYRQY